MNRDALETYYESLGATLGETLLTPTKIYVKALRSLKDGGVTVKACSHITGGGFYENIPRMLPNGVHAFVKKNSYEIPPIFNMLAKDGEIAEQMMYNTYNMGLGMMVAVDPTQVDEAIRLIEATGEKAYIVGEVKSGDKGVTLE